MLVVAESFDNRDRVSGEFFAAPVYVIPNVIHTTEFFNLHNLMVVWRELMIFGPPFLLLVIVKFGGLLGRNLRATSLFAMLLLGIILVLFAESNPFD